MTQETVLWEDAERVEFRTHVDGYRGKDRLLRVRFPADVPGGLPVYQTATAVIGRSFGVVDVDSADHWYTLDNPAHQWFGLGSTARVRTGASPGRSRRSEWPRSSARTAADGVALREVIRDLMAALAAAGVTATCSQAGGSRYGGIDADSNLPDVRIALGGPEANAFTAEVLSAAGPGYAKALAAGGTARAVRVPAARSRADAFAPSADVRGASDLPVLIVAGTGPGELAAAVTALAEDLADAAGRRVRGRPATPAVATAPLADRSVALLNRGTPGGVVTPDGTLHMSLMRSCSAWPSRIWIDGDPRTAPDGSSFAWQHWSHTFEYALASGPGDWRTAGFSASAEEYNHDLITVVAGSGEDIAGGSSLLTVEPANVTLSAVKPRGNPLASGRSPARRRARRGERRRGHRAAAGNRRAGHGGAGPARPADLRGVAHRPARGGGRRRRCPSGTAAAIVDMPAFGTVTLVAADRLARARGRDGLVPPSNRSSRSTRATGCTGRARRRPGTSRSPSTSPPPGSRWPSPGEAGLLTLTVGCGPEPASGTVELVVPDGITVTAEQDLRYELAPGGYAAWDLTVRAAPGTGPGRYFAAARIRDGHGHVIEDTAMVAVGERRWPDPALPPEEALMLMQADYSAAAAEVELAVLTPELRLAPGGRGELAGQRDQPAGVRGARRGAAGVAVRPLDDALAAGTGLQCHAAGARGAAFRGRGAGHGAARDPVLGAGQGDVLRPGPVHPGRAGPHRRRLVTTTLRANKVR